MKKDIDECDRKTCSRLDFPELCLFSRRRKLAQVGAKLTKGEDISLLALANFGILMNS